jgi:type I restriction-modification system DNA methylase subunit
MNLAEQNHLVYADRVNMGAYYTQDEYVHIAWDMLAPYINEKTVVLDSSCGYGNFLNCCVSENWQ